MRQLMIVALAVALSIWSVGTSLAQEAPTPNTITVIGMGSASGAPDIANLEIGVEAIDPDLATAYSDVNSRIDSVIDTLVAANIAREDIRTVGLNVFQDRFGGPNPQNFDQNGEPQPVFVVSNTIRVTIRDINNVPTVLETAINAGANNIFGLNFGIADTVTLASDARAEAMDDARQRAGELASLADVALGEIISISEVTGGFDPFNQFGRGGGGFGAVEAASIEPGQLAVNVQLQVTFAINQ